MGALAALALLVAAPLAAIMLEAFRPAAGATGSAFRRALGDPATLRMILNSLRLGAWVVLLSFVLSFPLALIMAKTDIGRHRWLEVLFLVPFMTPPYISSMGWILFMQKRGLLEQLLPWTAGLDSLFFSLPGLVLVMTLNVFPFMVRLLTNALYAVNANLEDAATVFGAPPFRRLFRITLPLLAGNIAIGALLVFVKTLSEYGAPATLGRRIGYEVFTSQIHFAATMAPVDFGAAAALSAVLMAICLLFWSAQHAVTKRHRYALVGSKGARTRSGRTSPAALAAGWTYIVLAALVSVGVPWFSVVATSLIKLRGKGLQAGNFTASHYLTLFTDDAKAVRALGTSLGLALAASLICAALGTALAVVIHRSAGRRRKLVESVSLLPEMVPNIVLVIGLMLFWNAVWKAVPLYNTKGMLVLSYTVLFLPFTVQYVLSDYAQIGEQLLQAAAVFGGRPRYVLFRILLPLLARGIAAGWTMTFIISFRELVASSLVSPPGVVTVSTYIMREFEQGSVPAGMCMAVVCVVLTSAILLAGQSFRRNERGR